MKPEAAKPEAAKPAAVKPEAAKPAAVKPEAAKPVAAKAEQAKPDPAKPAPAKRAANKPAVAAPEDTFTQRSSQIRARDRAALRTLKEQEIADGQQADGGPLTRRQIRLQQLKEQALTAATPIVPAPEQASAGQLAKPAVPAAPGTAPGPKGMTVEQALAARALIAEQARNQIAKMEHIASLDPKTADPEAVDPAVLAEQVALAERAAAVNRRAGASKPAPSTADNLAMVTPLEFVEVPGFDRPVMKRPATSHVPVVTRPGSKVASGPGRKNPPGPRAGRPAPDAGTSPSQVIARAEAAARKAAAPVPGVPAESSPDDLFADLPRIPAASAHGLDPLDAATAGLGRAQRNRLLQLCILVFGIVALVSGIVLIISGMSR
ncbi:hypothetical protein ASF72_10970 [Arthrobacter sp. Leaf141]|nr:hypothetical protein ASF72_10970 [Arthrobacter sp. Leaf141]